MIVRIITIQPITYREHQKSTEICMQKYERGWFKIIIALFYDQIYSYSTTILISFLDFTTFSGQVHFCRSKENNLQSQLYLLIDNYISSMERIRQKSNNYANSIRRQQRQQIYSSIRQWNNPPSPLFDLPLRIQRNDWSYFQQSLDTIQQHDKDLIDSSFKKYLFDQWNSIQNKHWTNQTCFNLVRALLRVNIAQRDHYIILIQMCEEAKQQFEKSQQPDAVIAIIRIIKQITISILIDASSKYTKFWQGQILEKLHAFLSSLKIMHSAIWLKDQTLNGHFKSFLPYYLVLLAHKKINLEELVKADNTRELFYVLSDSFEKNGSFEIENILKLIKKCFSMKESQYSSIIKSAIKIFFFEGIQQTLKFLENGISDSRKQGNFFNKLLSILNKADFQILSNSIQLLALIFDQFDECIPTILQTKITETTIIRAMSEPTCISKLDPTERQREQSKPTIYYDFMSFIESLMEHFSFQIRFKAYWLISNLTGSSSYFQEYGLRFISKMYQEDYYYRQLSCNNQIGHQISLCVLNYLCNINDHKQIQQLIQIIYEAKQQKAVKQKFIPKSEPNCLSFCLMIISDTLHSLQQSIEENPSILSNDQQVGVLQRCTYALEMIFQYSDQQTEIVLGILHKNKVPLLLQQIDSKINGSSQATKQLKDSIRIIEDHFSEHTQTL